MSIFVRSTETPLAGRVCLARRGRDRGPGLWPLPACAQHGVLVVASGVVWLRGFGVAMVAAKINFHVIAHFLGMYSFANG